MSTLVVALISTVFAGNDAHQMVGRPNPNPNNCRYKGRFVWEGQTVPKGDDCNTCTCHWGDMSCTRNPCPAPKPRGCSTSWDCDGDSVYCWRGSYGKPNYCRYGDGVNSLCQEDSACGWPGTGSSAREMTCHVPSRASTGYCVDPWSNAPRLMGGRRLEAVGEELELEAPENHEARRLGHLLRKFVNQFNPKRQGNAWQCPSSYPARGGSCASVTNGITCYYDEGTARCGGGYGLVGQLSTWRLTPTYNNQY